MAYASPDDLKKRYDVRTLGDLAGDIGVRVQPSDFADNAILLAALEDASGEVDSCLLQGRRYTAAQLAALTGNSLAMLKRITCEIAYGLLWERRSYVDDDRRMAAMDRARQTLNRLRKGEIVFDIDDVKDAGLPSIEGPSRVEIQRLNLTVDEARRGYYPRRRLPGEC